MTLFDECKEALSENFHLLSEDEKEQVLKEFYKYQFADAQTRNRVFRYCLLRCVQ